MDKYKLEYFIKDRGFTKEQFCEALEMSKVAFYRKCKGTSDFTRAEIVKITELLSLEKQDILDIFFAEKVS